MFPPTPSFITYQPACKPGSVWHARLRRYVTAIPLGRRLPRASSNQPGRRAGNRPAALSLARRPRAVPIRSCSRWGLPCRPVAGRAVRSYRTVSPLPPALADGRGGLFLWHFPWGRPRRTLSGTVVRGARTFLPGQPFGIAGAAVRPTDALRMGAPARRVKGTRWLIPAAEHNFDIRIAAAFDIEIVD